MTSTMPSLSAAKRARSGPRAMIFISRSRIDSRVSDHHARRHIGRRPEGAHAQSLPFQILNGLVLRPRDQHMGRAIHETGDDFHGESTQCSPNHRCEDHGIVDVSRAQGGDPDVGIHSDDFNIEALVFKKTALGCDAGGQKRDIQR